MSSSVGRNSAVMAMGTLASRITGQIRTILLAAAVGTTGIAANAYQTGSTIPQVLFTVLSGGVFNAVLVPQIVRTLKDKNAKEQLDKLITFAVVLLFGVTVVMMGCSSFFTAVYLDSSWTGAQRALANSFTLWCMPQIFFYGLYTVLGQILAAQNRFGAYAWSSTGANLISCAGFVAFIALYGNASRQPMDFWTSDKIALLAGAWTLGVAFQALVLFIPLLRTGYRWHFRLGVRGIGLRSMSSVAAWSLGIVLVNQLIGILTSRITNGAPMQGGDPYAIAGNSTYQNAFTLYILPYSLFAVSIATAMFPHLSADIADNNLRKAGRELSETLSNLTLIITFFTVAYLVEPEQITSALLPSVAPAEVGLIRVPLMILTLASLPSAISLVLERTFYAFKDGRTPFVYSVAQAAIQAIIILAGVHMFPPADWVAVVCTSTAACYLLTLPVLFIVTRRRFTEGFDDRHVIMSASRTFTAALLAIGAGLLLNGLFRRLGWSVLSIAGMWSRWLTAIVQALIITLAIGAVYAGVLAALKTPEIVTARRKLLAALYRLSRGRLGAPTPEGAGEDEEGVGEENVGEAGESAGSIDDGSAASDDAGANGAPHTKPRRIATSAPQGSARPRRIVSTMDPSPFYPDDTAVGMDIIRDIDIQRYEAEHRKAGLRADAGTTAAAGMDSASATDNGMPSFTPRSPKHPGDTAHNGYAARASLGSQSTVVLYPLSEAPGRPSDGTSDNATGNAERNMERDSTASSVAPAATASSAAPSFAPRSSATPRPAVPRPPAPPAPPAPAATSAPMPVPAPAAATSPEPNGSSAHPVQAVSLDMHFGPGAGSAPLADATHARHATAPADAPSQSSISAAAPPSAQAQAAQAQGTAAPSYSPAHKPSEHFAGTRSDTRSTQFARILRTPSPQPRNYDLTVPPLAATMRPAHLPEPKFPTIPANLLGNIDHAAAPATENGDDATPDATVPKAVTENTTGHIDAGSAAPANTVTPADTNTEKSRNGNNPADL